MKKAKLAGLLVVLAMLSFGATAGAETAGKGNSAAVIAGRAIMFRPGNSIATLSRAKSVLGRSLTMKQAVAVLAAHNTAPIMAGTKIGFAGIRAKTTFMQGHFTKGERKRLMDANVVGDYVAVMSHDPVTGKTYYDGREMSPETAREIVAQRFGTTKRNVEIQFTKAGYVVLPR